MKIGVLGSGKVARTLSAAWAEKGHDVYIGARNEGSVGLTEWQQSHVGNIRIGTLEESATYGDVVLIAINPWTEIEKALSPLANALQGKTIIDVSNNIIFDGQPKLAFADKSMGEFVQALLPESFVVKALNVTPAAMMVNPAKSGIVPTIGWVSGNNALAKSKVASLLQDLGWTEVVDLGDIHQSLLQENLGLILSLVVSSVMNS